MAKIGTSEKLYALSRVDHDGRAYEAGDAIERISAEQADALLAVGVVSRVAPNVDPEPSEQDA